MRSTRLLYSLLLAFSLVATVPGIARAGEGEGGTPAAEGEEAKPTEPASKIGEVKVEHERPTFGSKEAPSYAQGKRPTVNGTSWNTDPVVATNKAGRQYDKRTGRLLSNEQAEAAKKWDEGYEAKSQVTLIQGDTGEKAAGINAGPFKDGRANVVKGEYGEVNVDALRATGQGSYSAGITKDGVQAQGELKGQATLIGIQGETKTFQLGDPNGLNNASAKGEGQAYIGAEGTLDGHAGITKSGIGAGGNAEVFAGGKAEATGNATVTICGVQVNLQGEAEASYGIGAQASGQFSIDWSKMTVKFGAKAALTVGGGAGAGGTVEVSLAKVLHDPGAAAKCVAEHLAEAGKYVLEKGGEVVDAAGHLANEGIHKLSSAADSVGSHISGAASSVASFFGFGGHHHDSSSSNPPGFNGSRNQNTSPAMTAQPGVTARDAIGTKR